MDLLKKRAELQVQLDRTAGAIALLDEMLEEQAEQEARDAKPALLDFGGIDPWRKKEGQQTAPIEVLPAAMLPVPYDETDPA